jgi:hypothetical protein
VLKISGAVIQLCSCAVVHDDMRPWCHGAVVSTLYALYALLALFALIFSFTGNHFMQFGIIIIGLR